jgi:flagellar hook-length control protein FliK
MQVNLLTNLPSAAGEASAKSSEPADTGSASSFFIQMGKIWNPNDEDNNPQDYGKPVEAALNAAGQDPMGLLLSAALVSAQQTETNPIPTRDPMALLLGAASVSAQQTETNPVPTPDPSGSALKTGLDGTSADIKAVDRFSKKCRNDLIPPSIEDCIAAQAMSATMGIGNPFAPVGTAQSADSLAPVLQSGSQAETVSQAKAGASQNLKMPVEAQDISKTALDSPKVIFSSIMSTADSAIDSGSIASNIKMKSQSELPDSESGSLSSSESLSNNSGFKAEAGTNGISESLNLGINLQNKSASAIGKTSINPAGQGTGRSESVLLKTAQDALESIQRDAASSTKMHSESREDPTGQAGRNSDIYSAGVAAKAESSQDSVLQSEFFKLANPKKQESLSQANSGNANAGDSSENQGQSREESGSSTAQAIKLESSQTGVAQIRTSAGERQQDMQPAFTLNMARTAESGNLASESAAPAATSQPREFILQLADQIRVQVRDGKEEIRIQLKPDSLGRLEIKAETTLNGVTARITTESNNVKSYLENNLQFLQQTLQDQGLKIDRIHIVVQDAYDSQSPSGFTSQFGHAGSGQNSREPQTHAQSSGSSAMTPTDEMTVDPTTWLSLNPNNRFYTVA